MIFFFEAFDEQWKGIDDGWGLWDMRATRALRAVRHAGGPGLQCRRVRGRRLLRSAAVLHDHLRLARGHLHAGWLRRRGGFRRSWPIRRAAPTRWPGSIKSATAETVCRDRRCRTGPNLGRHDTVRRGQHAHDGAGLFAGRGHPGAAQGGGRGGLRPFGRDRGDHHGGQRLGDADLRLRQPGSRHAGAEPRLHLQQGDRSSSTSA